MFNLSHFWNQRKNTDLVIPNIDLFQEETKFLTLIRGLDSEKYLTQEWNFRKKLLKLWENAFSKQVLDFV
jgi:hypothetical protein